MTVVSESELRPAGGKGCIFIVYVVSCEAATCNRHKILDRDDSMSAQGEAMKAGWRFQDRRWWCPECA